jgi:hypothetical protein
MRMCMSRLHANTIQSVSVLCRVWLTVCMLLASVSAENEISVHTKILLSCVARWNTSSSNMNNVAYKWTHEKTIRNWQYTEINAPSRLVQLTSHLLPEATCVLIAYGTVVQLPPGFANYIPSQAMLTDVSRQLCSSKQQQRAHRNSSLFEHRTPWYLYSEAASIDNEEANATLDSTCDMVLPWFAQPLRQIIFAHISNSILEYMHILADSLCL